MRQTKTKSRVAQVDFVVAKAINFGNENIECLASASRSENLNASI